MYPARKSETWIATVSTLQLIRSNKFDSRALLPGLRPTDRCVGATETLKFPAREYKCDLIGIMAYGSLIEDPGPEIKAARARVVSGLTTPFKVEFARKSRSRGDAPTLVPVTQGGAHLPAQIIVLKEHISEADAQNLIWRRETRQIGTGRPYIAKEHPGANTTIVRRIENSGGVDIVFYTEIGANIEPLTSAELARLAIESVMKAELGKDGISYLMATLGRQVETPLSNPYREEILGRVGVNSLAEALEVLRKTCCTHSK